MEERELGGEAWMSNGAPGILNTGADKPENSMI